MSKPVLDLSGLLTIDVASELRKLCAAQLEGLWQLPAELVRRALRGGATSVRVTFGRHRVVVADDGPGLDPSLLRATAALLDGRQSDIQRHAALTALESAGELALLALGGVDLLRSLSLHSNQGPQRLRLDGVTPVLTVEKASGVGTEIAVEAPGLDRAQATRWLAEVARFSPVPITVDGAAVNTGFAGTMVEAGLRAPLHGRIALPAEGDTAVAYLLAHGIVTARITVPDAPAFEAAVEVGNGGGDLTPARLRETLAPQLPALIGQAQDLIASAAAACPTGSEPIRARLAHLALQAAQRTGQERIERVALFRVIGPTGPALASLSVLRQAAGGGDSPTLMALSPEQRLDRYLLGAGPLVIAGDAERSQLAEVLGVRFVPPSLRASSGSLSAALRRAARAVGRAAAATVEALRPGRPHFLDDEALTAAERALLTALRPYLRGTNVALCPGRGRPRRRGTTLVLPRADPTVTAAVRAYQENPRWLRQIHLALTGTTTGAPR